MWFYNKIIEFFTRVHKNTGVRKFLTWFIVILAVVCSVLTYLSFSGAVLSESPKTMLILLNIDLVLLLLLLTIIIFKMIRIWLGRKRNIAGSSLHVKLVVLFMLVAGTPTILVTVFSALFFNISIKSWFGEQVQTAVSSSLVVAENYYRDARHDLASDVIELIAGLVKQDGYMENMDKVHRYLEETTKKSNITEIVIVDDRGRVQAAAGDVSGLQGHEIPMWSVLQAKQGTIAIDVSENDDKIRALMLMDKGKNLYIYAGRKIDEEIMSYISKARGAINRYQSLERHISSFEIVFTVIFIAIALILLLASVFFGYSLSTAMLKPVVKLIEGSEKASRGELDFKVPEPNTNDELDMLTKSFNNMMEKISQQQNELIKKNSYIDERRRLIEAILAGVSSGVVSLTKDMRIRMANVTARNLLGDLEVHKGQELDQVIPQMEPLISRLRESLFKNVHDEIKVNVGNVQKVLLVRVVSEYEKDDIVGYVCTFDDITELQDAQRKAAWADVARRVAHEIKNPLTPIQLAAERLKKKYAGMVKEGDNSFVICTDTIIRQVEDIGKMVDEFSRFAKMPVAFKRRNDINDIIGEALFIQKNAYRDIECIFNPNLSLPLVNCDRSQIIQVLINLMKNSAESIESKLVQMDFTPYIKLSLAFDGEFVIVSVEDNGRGVNNEDLARITEPYVTTKEKGTGIGLAIVKKIVEDHGGEMSFSNVKSGGFQVAFSIKVE